MDSIALFANPIAGRGKARLLLDKISHSLEHAGYIPHRFLQPASQLAADHLATVRACQAVIVIGGDGTVRQVVDRVTQAAAVTHPPFLMVPLGTANLLAQFLNLHWDKSNPGPEIVQALKQNKTTEIDAASVSQGTEESEQGTGQRDNSSTVPRSLSPVPSSLMLLVAGVGIDGKVVHELSRLRRGPITKLSYALPAALALGQYRFPPLQVSVDGVRVWHKNGIALVGNIKEYGTGFPILPHARPDDGLLDLCALSCSHPGELVKLFLSAAAGEHLEEEGALYLKGKSIQIESDEPAPVQVDGEPAGFTPIRIHLLPKRVRFLIP